MHLISGAYAPEAMQAAIEEARIGLSEGGIPIGSVIAHQGRIIGRKHNRRVQRGSAILHAEMDALENAGRTPFSFANVCANSRSRSRTGSGSATRG